MEQCDLEEEDDDDAEKDEEEEEDAREAEGEGFSGFLLATMVVVLEAEQPMICCFSSPKKNPFSSSSHSLTCFVNNVFFGNNDLFFK